MNHPIESQVFMFYGCEAQSYASIPSFPCQSPPTPTKTLRKKKLKLQQQHSLIVFCVIMYHVRIILP